MTAGTRRARIAVVVPTLEPAGAERVARSLATEFAKTADVTVVTFAPRLSARTLRTTTPLPWAERVPAGCDHVHLPATGSGVRRLFVLAIRFAHLARTRRFDAVYTFLTYTNVVVALARVKGRGRYVHVASEHAMADNLRSNGNGLRRLSAILPVAYRLPDHVVVVSESALHSLRAAQMLPRPERAIAIYNPIDVTAVRRLAAQPAVCREMDRLAAQGVVVACFARLHPQKGHRTLLRAIGLLPPEYSLLVVGDGPMRPELESFADETGVRGRTGFVHAVDNPYPLMRRANVVVLPSVEEGFGLVALEAAALGVPFIGSDTGGLAELCGILGQPTFPVGDAVALASLITQLAAHGSPDVAPETLQQFELANVARAYRTLVTSVSPATPSSGTAGR
jgi:glycosyltransferase involved in cell wall biosynthesis